mmetsp:Transcript_5695/g.9494  ORF Transcript_5695/g.9494 Transcript_5695/m.9494 type:complete len:246 (-) Transcript_5695:212-949(-)
MASRSRKKKEVSAFLCSLYAHVNGTIQPPSGGGKKTKLQEFIRIVRAICPNAKSELPLNHYELVFKPRKGSASKIHLWCDLIAENKQDGDTSYNLSKEFNMLQYSRPLPQQDHQCFVRGYDTASKVSPNFGSLLAFLNYEFEYEYVAKGLLFRINPNTEIKIYQTMKIVENKYEEWSRDLSKEGGNSAKMKVKFTWGQERWWIVELRSTCKKPGNLMETEKNLKKMASAFQDYGEFYANIARAKN